MDEAFIYLTSYRETLKLFHFQISTYAYHKASDELIVKFDDLTDTLFESWQGMENHRISLKTSKIVVRGQQHKQDICKYSKDIITYLMTINDPELTNVRDEIVTAINKFIYLLSFL